MHNSLFSRARAISDVASPPDDLELELAVVMADPVAHADNLVKRDVRKRGARLGSQACSCFPGDQKAPQDRVLRLAVLQKLLARLPGDVAPNDLDRTKDIEQ